MTRQECIALLDRYANYDGMGIPNLAGCREAMKMAVELLSQPSLPSDIDYTANRYTDENYYELLAPGDLANAFKAGAEWQKKQDKETIELAEDHAYFAGGINEREKMMEGAVDCYYGYVNNCTKVFLPEETLKGIKEGYVKIVILKNDE